MADRIQLGSMIGSVGDERQCLGRYNDFYDFRAWVVHHVAKGEMIEFTESGVSVYHWDRISEQKFPNVLLTQECGQYLPMSNIDLQPRIGNSIELVTELQEIETYRVLMPLEVQHVFDVLLHLAKLSVEKFEIMEFSNINLTNEFK